MNTITLREFRETGTKYKKLRKRIDKRIKTGSFYQLTKRKQRNLISRVRKLRERLLRLQNLLKLATAGATMALVMTAGQVDAQKFNEKGIFKQTFNSSIKGAKAYESDIFVQMTGDSNPFGGTNPFSGNIVDESRYSSFVDIDNDGDLDVFTAIYDYATHGFYVNYYKNTGDNLNSFLVEQTGADNPFDGKLFDSTPQLSFVDIDNDGDLDVFINYEYYDIISYYKNDGTAENPIFVEYTNDENPLNGVSPQQMKRLSFADIDNDGDLDVFIGLYDSHPFLYTNNGDAENPNFIPGNFPDFFDATFVDFESVLHKDVDGDGDFDALINGNRYFENQGDNLTPSFIEQIDANNPFGDLEYIENNLPELIDVDADGDFDLLVGFGQNIKMYKNIGDVNNPSFEDANGGIESAYYVMQDFVDIDNDGDYDMFTAVYNAGYFNLAYYKNVGTPVSPEFEMQDWDNNPLADIEIMSYISTPRFVDIDNDGDLDLFLGAYSTQEMRFFENTGTPEVPIMIEKFDAENPLDEVTYIASMDFADIDNDGDLDFFFGSADPGLHFYRNTGTATEATYAPETNPIDIPLTWNYILPKFADIDNDGDLDLFAGTIVEGIDQWKLMFLLNEGTADTPDFVEQTGDANPLNISTYTPSLSFIDIDDDGDLDAFVGSYDGVINYFRNKTLNVGVSNIENNTFNVYPNPANNEITIDLSSYENEEVQISIIDITGKTVSNYNLTNYNRIDVSQLTSGVYFIKVNNLKQSKTAKFIVK